MWNVWVINASRKQLYEVTASNAVRMQLFKSDLDMFRSSTKFTYVKAIFIKATDRRLFLISKPISLGLRLYNWEHDTSTFWEANSFSTSQETLRVVWNIKVYYSRGAQIRVEYISRFAPNIFRTITAVFSPSQTKMCVRSYAPNRKRKITVRFRGHCRIVGPQCGTCIKSPFWRIKFGGGAYTHTSTRTHRVKLGYNVIKGIEYFVLL